MSYSVLSKYRGELMGMATIWVMLFHAWDLDLGHQTLNWLQSIGYGGVDIFILLSAMSLTISLARREQDYSSFMARRAGRILPAYYLAVVPCTLFFILHDGAPWSALIWNCSLLYYWIQPAGAFNWYVAGIMTFYVITPMCFRRLRDSRRRELLTAGGVLASLAVCQVLMRDKFWIQMDFMCRVPIFFLGLLLGFYVLENREIGLRDSLFWCCWAGLGAVYQFAVNRAAGGPFILSQYHLFLFSTVPMCLALCWLFQRLPLGWLCRGLRFLGTYSLDIYLLNVLFVVGGGPLRRLLFFIPGSRLYYLFTFAANIALAVPFHRLADRLRRTAERKPAAV